MDELLAYLGQVHPEIPRLSVGGEQRLAKKAQQEASRYLKELTPQAQSAREELERARKFLSGYPELTAQLAAAAKAKRINEHTNPAYRWVALAIVLAARRHWCTASSRGAAAAISASTSRSSALPPCSSSRERTFCPRQRITAGAGRACLGRGAGRHGECSARGLSPPRRYAHPIVLDRMIRILREGRAQSKEEGARRAQSRPQGAHRRRAGRAGGARRGRGHQASVPCERLSISRKQRRTLYRLHRALPFFAFETVSVQNIKLFVYFMLAIFFSLCIISLVL